MAKKHTVRKILFRLAAAVIFLAGLCMLAYPAVSNLLYEQRQERLAAYYTDLAAHMTPEQRSQEWDRCFEYNRTLLEGAARVTDPFGEEGGGSGVDRITYNDLLNLRGDGAMGVINIPGMTGNLMIYHGIAVSTLQKGVGHLPGSSLPVGGEGSHCVLSAHSGLPDKQLFTNLDRMQEGDVFYLHILNETLAYQVDMIKVILPHETEDLAIIPDRDLVTLVTCTPYGINSHRLLVRGTRIPYEEAQTIAATASRGGRLTTWQRQYIRAALAGIIIVALFIAVYIIVRHIRKKVSR